MYAARRIYTQNWDHQPVEERYSVQLSRGGKPVKGIASEEISYVEQVVMYWRKANHIHGWFVDNVQNGDDNCQTYDVSQGDLIKLFDVCEKILEASVLVDGEIVASTTYDKDHPEGIDKREPGKVIQDATVAENLLPTREGFFFGSTEYDEDYLEDVKSTRDWIVRMVGEHEEGVPGTITYSSSW
jgi:hypothetical protein